MEAVNVKNPCAPALDWCNTIDPATKLTEAIGEKLLTEGEKRWFYWALEQVGDQMDGDARKLFLSGVVQRSRALQLYIKLDFWDDEDDAILLSKFKGKLPKAENELLTGKVKRAKDKN